MAKRRFLIVALCVLFTGPEAMAQTPTSRADDIGEAYGEDSEKIGLVAEYSDHAILAWAAYRDQSALSLAADRGWDPMSYIVRGRRGLKSVQAASQSDDVVAVIFRKGNQRAFGPNDEYVIAFRGSDFSKLEDWVANGQVVLPILPEDRVKEAADLARKMEDAIATHHPGELRKFDFVGHSLGGRLAMVARHATGRDAVVFNSSPLSAREIGYLVTSKAGFDSKLVAFRSPQDPLVLVDPVFAQKAIEVENIDRARVITGFREVYPNGLVPDETGAPNPDFTTAGSTPAVVEGGEQFSEWVSYNHSIAVLANAMQDVRNAFPPTQQQQAQARTVISTSGTNQSVTPSQGSGGGGQSGERRDEKVTLSCEAAQWEGLLTNVADLFECERIRAMQSLAGGRSMEFEPTEVEFSSGKLAATQRSVASWYSVMWERATRKGGMEEFNEKIKLRGNPPTYDVVCRFDAASMSKLREGQVNLITGSLTDYRESDYGGNKVILSCEISES